MTKLILPFSDVEATLENVGGKGMSLAKLSRAGLPVPGGFFITTAAYRQFVAENGYQARILAALKGADTSDPTCFEPISRQIGELFTAGCLPPEIAAAVSEAYAALTRSRRAGAGDEKEISVAVRSSATAEDLPEASFAGQQDTYLNIRGTQNVLEAVKSCWASLWTARAMAYRAKQNIAPEEVALAVVVQELVFADAAGVMFTANPVDGRRDELMITASWGLGEAIVSGAVTPDTITVNKLTGRPVRRETAEKLIMTVRTDSGTREQPVPNYLRKARVLKDTRLAELARMSVEIEKLYGVPMDIEWADAKGSFAILQARPVTALPEAPLEWPVSAPGVILMRGSLAEFLPDPVSTLFGSLAVPIAGEASLEMMRRMAGLDDPDGYIMTVVNGYVYIGLKMVFKVIWPLILMSTVAARKMLDGAKERWLASREKYRGLVQGWQGQELAGMTARSLLAGVREIFAMTAEYYTAVQSSTIPSALSSEMLFTNLYGLLVKRKGEPAAATFLFGAENQPLRAEKSLYDLAMWVKEYPELMDTLLAEPAGQICGRLCGSGGGADWDELRRRFAGHLAEYGHTIYDLDFAKPVPADDPAPLVESLKDYLNGTASNPYERQQTAVEQRERQTRGVVERLDPLRRKWFLKQLKWAQECAPLREDSIADIGLGQPQMRRMLGELGRRLAQAGAIAVPEDIYWLEAWELEGLATELDQRRSVASQAAVVNERKVRWQAVRKVTPPSVLPKNSLLARFAPREDQPGATLKGMGASAGKVTARACVMRGPEDFGRLQPGDIIVAVITTPAWTPLFARASAVVTDIGGPLSHSSIVAREYGIPAVLGTGAATRRIQDGQIIRVDGDEGTVSLV